MNNESSEIIRMFNTEFNDLIPADRAKIDIYPKELREEIDSINDWVYNAINSSPFVFSRVRGVDALSAQMEFTRPGLRTAQKHMKPPCIQYSRPWTRPKRCSRARNFSSAINSLKLTSDSGLLSCVLLPPRVAFMPVFSGASDL